MPKRIALLVYVDLDTAPGEMYTEESAEMSIYAILNDRISHYRPKVEIAPAIMQPEQRLKALHAGFYNGHISYKEYISALNRVNPE